jgi:hypothetical protein
MKRIFKARPLRIAPVFTVLASYAVLFVAGHRW